jgi:hypothetical protein
MLLASPEPDDPQDAVVAGQVATILFWGFNKYLNIGDLSAKSDTYL